MSDRDLGAELDDAIRWNRPCRTQGHAPRAEFWIDEIDKAMVIAAERMRSRRLAELASISRFRIPSP
jgi:hypothetical protein